MSRNNKKSISRRNFLILSGWAVVGIGIGKLHAQGPSTGRSENAASGYLLVDPKKCQGCLSCMLACSLVHEGRENLSLARIQVTQNPFAGYPGDLSLNQCRQCVSPACLNACPSGALHINPRAGNLRFVDVEKCIGCRSCVEACPFPPGRAIWNFEEKHAQLCDLCAHTPFWNKSDGDKESRACVEVCPVKAIKFSRQIPVQAGDSGYQVNLRGKAWKKLGYPTD